MLQILTRYHLKKNFVLSAFNLAFIGSWVSKDIKIYNELYCWPDGLFKNTLLKNIPKLPGRDLIKNIKIPSNIDKIRIIGNSSSKVENFLNKNFKFNILINNKLPYGKIEDIKNVTLNYQKMSCMLSTYSKTRNYSVHLKTKNKNFHILCIGGGLKMASGEENHLPNL